MKYIYILKKSIAGNSTVDTITTHVCKLPVDLNVT